LQSAKAGHEKTSLRQASAIFAAELDEPKLPRGAKLMEATTRIELVYPVLQPHQSTFMTLGVTL
jgi:hypothetical protein